jgi:hypothetical protein
MDQKKPSPLAYADDFESSAEREAARRAELYKTHKLLGTLGLYFYMFPDEAPPCQLDQPRTAETENEM